MSKIFEQTTIYKQKKKNKIINLKKNNIKCCVQVF